MKTLTSIVTLMLTLQLARAGDVKPKYDPVFGYSIVLPETMVTADRPTKGKSQPLTNYHPIFGYAIVMPELIVNAVRPDPIPRATNDRPMPKFTIRNTEPAAILAAVCETTYAAPCFKSVTGNYTIAPADTVREDVTVTGGNATIDGVLEGDLAVMGGTCLISGEITNDVAVFGGNMEITGRVLGDAAVMGGTVSHRGTIEGDLVVVGGTVALDSGSVIEGDVSLIGGDVDRNDNAVVEGEVKAVPIEQISKLIPGIAKAFQGKGRLFGQHLPRPRLIAGVLSISALVVIFIMNLLAMVIFPKAMEAVSHKIENELWVSVAIGFGLQISIAPILILFSVSIIGIPLIPVFCLAVALATVFGFSAWSGITGERLARGFNWQISNRVGLFTLGWITTVLILLIGTLLCCIGIVGILILVLGWTIVYIAGTIGLGATVYAMFKAIK